MSSKRITFLGLGSIKFSDLDFVILWCFKNDFMFGEHFQIDQDFLAKYLSNYGVTASSDQQVSTPDPAESDKCSTAQSSTSDAPNTQAVKRKANETEGMTHYCFWLIRISYLHILDLVWRCQHALQNNFNRYSNITLSGWFEVEDQHNTNVYVSGLPLDITEEEFIELMSKCGIIMKDQDISKLKVKLYCDAEGNVKGDARCCYIKV